MSSFNPWSLGRRHTRHAREVGEWNLVEVATVLGHADHRFVQNVPLDRARPRLVGAPRDGPRPVTDWQSEFTVLVSVDPQIEVRASRADGGRSLDGLRELSDGPVQGRATLEHDLTPWFAWTELPTAAFERKGHGPHEHHPLWLPGRPLACVVTPLKDATQQSSALHAFGSFSNLAVEAAML